MFSDPQIVKIDTVDISLPRVLTGTPQGAFVSQNGTTDLSVETKRGNVVRHVVRLTQRKVTQDPLTTTNVAVFDQIELRINRPKDGFLDAEVEKQVLGLVTWLTASTNANLKKLIAGEN